MRHDDRKINQLREITIETDYLMHPEGSVLISFGNTKVIVNATIEDNVPPFLRGSETGWVTAETVCYHEQLTRVIDVRVVKEN